MSALTSCGSGITALMRVRSWVHISGDNNLPDTAELDQDRHQRQKRLYEYKRQEARRDVSYLLHSTEQLCVNIQQSPQVQQLHVARGS